MWLNVIQSDLEIQFHLFCGFYRFAMLQSNTYHFSFFTPKRGKFKEQSFASSAIVCKFCFLNKNRKKVFSLF